MIDDHVDREARFHARRVAPRVGDGIAQRGKILQHRKATGVRKDHAGYVKRQIRVEVVAPVGQRRNFLIGDRRAPCLVAAKVFQQDANYIGIGREFAAQSTGNARQIDIPWCHDD